MGWLLARWRALPPPALLVVSFLAMVAVATAGLLLLPGLHAGERLGAVDALFTATSAVCVTGLVVVDTGTAFTFWGQLWLLVAIQLGGLGLITLTTLVIGAMGQQLSLRSELLTSPQVGTVWDPRALAAATTRFMLGAEAVGAVLLWVWWAPRLGAVEAIWPAVFHAVSAFCNAGFSTFTTSLEGFSSDPITLLLVAGLIVIGGLGYLVFRELVRFEWSGRRVRMSVHSFAALTTTATLIVLGTALYALLEWDGLFAAMSPGDRLANAFFASVTARTAGFNAVPYGGLGGAALLVTMLLMFVGGSPGSTAGGVKTTSLAILFGLARSRARGKRHVELHGRSVPPGTVERTASLVLVSVVTLTAAILVVLVLEDANTAIDGNERFLPLAFEVVSAFGTVGLSMGETGRLSDGGKLAISALMFIGRVGPLAFFAAMSLRAGRLPPNVRSAREDVFVG